MATPVYPIGIDAETRRAVFRAPSGPVVLSPRGYSLAFVVETEIERAVSNAPSEPQSPSPIESRARVFSGGDDQATFELAPGPNRLELRARRQFAVRFTFRDGAAAVPWSWEWRLRAVRVDGKARDIARSIGTLWFREEGSYELFSDGIPGFASIDGTRFEVRAGAGLSGVTVPLLRQ